METRNLDDAQVVTKCNVCGQGEYELSNEVVLEDMPEPVYYAEPVEPESEDLPVE